MVTLICAVAAGRAAEISSGSGVVINAKGEILQTPTLSKDAEPLQ